MSGSDEAVMADGIELLDAALPVLPVEEQTVATEQVPAVWQMALWGGLGSFLAILLIQLLARQIHLPLLLAPFGASCVLLFLASQAEFSQPRNLILGYGIGTAIGFAAIGLFPGQWWTVALAVGLTIALMRLTHSVHPPAGAQPIVIVLTMPGWKLLLPALLLGVGLLLVTAWGFHRIVRHEVWPLRWL